MSMIILNINREIIIGMLWRKRLSTPHTDFGAILEIIEATISRCIDIEKISVG